MFTSNTIQIKFMFVIQWYDCYLCYKQDINSVLSCLIMRSMTIGRKIMATISGADDTTWIWIGIGIAWWCIVTTCNCTNTNALISASQPIFIYTDSRARTTWIWWSCIWFNTISNKLQYDNHNWWPLWDVYLWGFFSNRYKIVNFWLVLMVTIAYDVYMMLYTRFENSNIRSNHIMKHKMIG